MKREVDPVEHQAGKPLERPSNHPKVEPDVELDLRGVICPYNFVKTKLKLDTMDTGRVLSVILDEGEPIRNVPQSVQNEGHEILIQEPIDDALYRVLIKKGGHNP